MNGRLTPCLCAPASRPVESTTRGQARKCGVAKPRTGGWGDSAPAESRGTAAPRLRPRHGPEPLKHIALSHPHLTIEETEAQEVMQRLMGSPSVGPHSGAEPPALRWTGLNPSARPRPWRVHFF